MDSYDGSPKPVEQRIAEFDLFGEPSYKLCELNTTKALQIAPRKVAFHCGVDIVEVV